MARIFMTHKVTDYAKWKAIYDADAERRAGAGIREAGHFHNGADQNDFHRLGYRCRSSRNRHALKACSTIQISVR